MKYDHIFGWGNNSRRREIKGKRCRVLAPGSKMFSVLLEFEDGTKIVSSVRAIRRAKDPKTAKAP